jgi:hypothetical protein
LDGWRRTSLGRNGDRDHAAAMANRAFSQRMARESLISIAIVLRCRKGRRKFAGSHAEKVAALLQLLLAMGIGEEAVVTNAVKPTQTLRSQYDLRTLKPPENGDHIAPEDYDALIAVRL